MSAEKVDHFAGAEELLVRSASPNQPVAHQEVAASHAQVHATLALVEQQKLANTIAAIVRWGGDSEAWPLAIREGLGLE